MNLNFITEAVAALLISEAERIHEEFWMFENTRFIWLVSANQLKEFLANE